MTNAFAKVLETIPHKVQPRKDDRMDEDGCVVCGQCGKRREAWVTWIGGSRKLVPCMCDCEKEELDRQKLLEERKQKSMRIQQIQSYGFAPSQIGEMTFRNCDPDGENAKLAANYAKNFDALAKEGAGLLFYGNVGTGKTFLAGCIVNYLQTRYRTAFMTSFSRLNRELTAWNKEDKTAALDRITNCDLLVIDDLGTERKLLETAFEVVDQRVNTGRPMIVTTNLNAAELGTDELAYRRIFDRIKGCCKPVYFRGESRRKRGRHEDKWAKVDALLRV